MTASGTGSRRAASHFTGGHRIREEDRENDLHERRMNSIEDGCDHAQKHDDDKHDCRDENALMSRRVGGSNKLESFGMLMFCVAFSTG